MATAKSIKDKIKTLLEELKTAGTLGEVQVDDLKVGIFDRDFGAFPVAVLATPSIESGLNTNRENLRTYTYEVVVVQKAENATDANSIEDLAEAILNKFDADMLSGTASQLRIGGADGGVEPSTSTPEAVVSRGKTYVVFSVFVRASAIYTS